MAKHITVFLITVFSLISFACRAAPMTCPEPKSILENQGIPPKPWGWNPVSDRAVVSDSDQFYKAEILVAGYSGLGVLCFYKKSSNSNQIYSIWWQVPVARQDRSKWVSIPTGYRCQDKIEECTFNVAQ